MAGRSFFGEATLMGVVPSGAQKAFSLLTPMTAPMPLWPAAWSLSPKMPANFTRFSPAGPMQKTLIRCSA